MSKKDKELIKKRNKKLLELKDSCCQWGKDLLEQIEQATELNSLALAYAPFVTHATDTNSDCSLCHSVLIQANTAIEY